MVCNKAMFIAGLVAMLVSCVRCERTSDDLSRVLEKYSNPPDSRTWELIEDTKEFWADVATLYRHSMMGNEDAFKAYLEICYHSDGYFAEGLESVHPIVERHPEMARKVYLKNSRLCGVGGHLVLSDEELARIRQDE